MVPLAMQPAHVRGKKKLHTLLRTTKSNKIEKHVVKIKVEKGFESTTFQTK